MKWSNFPAAFVAFLSNIPFIFYSGPSSRSFLSQTFSQYWNLNSSQSLAFLALVSISSVVLPAPDNSCLSFCYLQKVNAFSALKWYSFFPQSISAYLRPLWERISLLNTRRSWLASGFSPLFASSSLPASSFAKAFLLKAFDLVFISFQEACNASLHLLLTSP